MKPTSSTSTARIARSRHGFISKAVGYTLCAIAAIATVATIAAITAVAVTTQVFIEASRPAPDVRKQPSPAEIRRQKVAQCKAALERARAKARRQAILRSQEIDTWIAGRAKGTRAFADEVLSFSGKWAVVKSKLPFTDEDGARKYINEQLETHLFSESQLNASCGQQARLLANDITQIHNELVVEIERILPASNAGRGTSVDTGAYRPARDNIQGQIETETGRQVAIFVATEAVSAITSRIACTTVGAAFAPETFGISLVAGFAVDAIISVFRDPEGDLTKELDVQFARIRQDVAAKSQEAFTRAADASFSDTARQIQSL